MESGTPLVVGGVYLTLRHSTKIENIFCETKCDWLNLKVFIGQSTTVGVAVSCGMNTT